MKYLNMQNNVILVTIVISLKTLLAESTTDLSVECVWDVTSFIFLVKKRNQYIKEL